MSRIRSRNTKPELVVRQLLHRRGYRYRLHRKDLPGSPDIVLTKYKTVIFVHGCYWHRHAGCRYTYTPKSRIDFWNKKFSDTVERDKKHKKELDELGWRVGVIWECETKNIDNLFAKVKKILKVSV
jgi:DNA mismatch endonuclease, patch repair protein